jgi:hypothetical protein
MADIYLQSLIDPFNQTVTSPKILDGSVTRSSGVRFRNTGSITLDATGAPTYIILFGGFSYGLNWKTAAGAPSMPAINPSHLGLPTDRASIRQIRLVSAGLQLSLENSSDENEGYWEAIRIPCMSDIDFTQTDLVAPLGEDYGIRVVNSFAWPDMANHSTFQTGKLRDLHRFQFKLNSVAPDHPFKRIVANNVSPFNNQLIDDFFDVVVIKVVGRIDAVTPSSLRYNTVSNQEVVYTDGTALSRLQTISPMTPNTDVVLDKTRYMLPAIQIS